MLIKFFAVGCWHQVHGNEVVSLSVWIIKPLALAINPWGFFAAGFARFADFLINPNTPQAVFRRSLVNVAVEAIALSGFNVRVAQNHILGF